MWARVYDVCSVKILFLFCFSRKVYGTIRFYITILGIRDFNRSESENQILGFFAFVFVFFCLCGLFHDLSVALYTSDFYIRISVAPVLTSSK